MWPLAIIAWCGYGYLLWLDATRRHMIDTPHPWSLLRHSLLALVLWFGVW